MLRGMSTLLTTFLTPFGHTVSPGYHLVCHVDQSSSRNECVTDPKWTIQMVLFDILVKHDGRLLALLQ